MKIYGIGTDIIAIARIAKVWDKYGLRFAKHILAPQEIVQLQQHKQAARFLAKRFAAKEALAKALGTGFRANMVHCNQIAVINDSLGKPAFKFLDQTLNYISSLGSVYTHLSIADTQEHATAFVVVELVAEQ